MKLIEKIKSWFSTEEVRQLKLQLDASDDVSKQIEKDLDKCYKAIAEKINENKQVKDELNNLQKKYDELISISLENKTKYANLKHDYSKTLVFLENILNQVQDQVVGTSAYLDALVPPK